MITIRISYWATPLANGYSSAELLIGRKLCSTIPMLPEMYKPNLPPHSEILQKNSYAGQSNKITSINVTDHTN